MDKIDTRLGVPIDEPLSVKNNMRYFQKLNATIDSLPTGTLARAVFYVATTYGDQSQWTEGTAVSRMAALPWGILGATLRKHIATLKEVSINIKYGHKFASEVNASILDTMHESLRGIIRFCSVEETQEAQEDLLEKALKDLGLEDEDEGMEVSSLS